MPGLLLAAQNLGGTLTQLCIAACKSLKFTAETFTALATSLPRLTNLTISYSQLLAPLPSPSYSPSLARPVEGLPPYTMPENADLISAFAMFASLTTLNIYDITQDTSNCTLFRFGKVIQTLRRLVLYRRSYESDFIVTDMYAKVCQDSSRVDDKWVKEFNDAYRERECIAELKMVSCLKRHIIYVQDILQQGPILGNDVPHIGIVFIITGLAVSINDMPLFACTN
jgi:hypothetical protein